MRFRLAKILEAPGLRGMRARLRRWGALRSFRREYERFRALSAAQAREMPMAWSERFPCLEDRTVDTPFDRHYIYHCAWAMRVLAHARPAHHVDLGSSLHFVTMASAIAPISFWDIRPPRIVLPGLATGAADLTRLPFRDASLRSVSCMHVIEHIGLGRYGDRLDPHGDVRAVEELRRVIAPGGELLFVVPVGSPRIRFNAHRIYSLAQVRQFFAGWTFIERALIPDHDLEHRAGLVFDVNDSLVETQEYACGCFRLQRPIAETN